MRGGDKTIRLYILTRLLGPVDIGPIHGPLSKRRGS